MCLHAYASDPEVLKQCEFGQVSSSRYDCRRLHCIKTAAPKDFVDQTPEGSMQGISTSAPKFTGD